MNLYHLRYFTTLARLEHYTKAAEELMITQPSLSHAIATLENEVGVSLFEKVGRNIQLTRYGQEFLRDVEAALRILDSSVKNLKMTGMGEGVIELGFVRTLGTDLVPRLVRGFIDQNPKKLIHFNLSTDSGLSHDLLEGLKSKKYDLVFCSKLDHEPNIEFVPIASQELVVVVPTDHPLADKASVTLEETLPFPQIIFKHKSGLRQIVDSLFAKVNGYPIVKYEVEEDQVVAGFVANSFGIAVVPRMDMLELLPVKVIPLTSPNWERNFYVAALKEAYRAPIVEDFRQFAINSVGPKSKSGSRRVTQKNAASQRMAGQ